LRYGCGIFYPSCDHLKLLAVDFALAFNILEEIMNLKYALNSMKIINIIIKLILTSIDKEQLEKFIRILDLSQINIQYSGGIQVLNDMNIIACIGQISISLADLGTGRLRYQKGKN